jgi:hypothetical protein
VTARTASRGVPPGLVASLVPGLIALAVLSRLSRRRSRSR